jgi:hypothetical protein
LLNQKHLDRDPQLSETELIEKHISYYKNRIKMNEVMQKINEKSEMKKV